MSARHPGPGPSLRRLHDGGLAQALRLDEPLTCDACDVRIDGEPHGCGLLVWARGDERRHEEPPLCEACACAIGLAALAQWELEEDGGD